MYPNGCNMSNHCNNVMMCYDTIIYIIVSFRVTINTKFISICMKLSFNAYWNEYSRVSSNSDFNNITG